jgi:hypothetical protein
MLHHLQKITLEKMLRLLVSPARQRPEGWSSARGLKNPASAASRRLTGN